MTLNAATPLVTDGASPSVSQFAAWNGGALDWERLPTMTDSIAERLARLLERHRGAAHAAAPAQAESRWTRTQAAEFDALPLSEDPFRETLKGLATREVSEPAVFRYFFGAGRGA